jgi:hypothetical protein
LELGHEAIWVPHRAPIGFAPGINAGVKVYHGLAV